MKKFKSLLFMFVAALMLAVSCETPEPGPDPNPPTPPVDSTEVALEFEVTMGEIDMVSAKYTIIPSVSDAEYLHIVVREEAMGDMEPMELAEAILAEMQETAEGQGETLEEYLPDFLVSGNLTNHKVSGLTMGTGYALVVFGVDFEAEELVNSEVEVVPFETEGVEKIDCTFEVTVEAGSDESEITVVPSNETVTYHLMHVGKEYFEYYTNPDDPEAFTVAEFYDAYLAMYIDNLRQNGMTTQEIFDAIFVEGTNTFSATGLVPNTSYQYLVAAVEIIEESFAVLSDVTLGSYTTDEPEYTGMTFDIQVDNIKSNSFRVSVTPSDLTATYCWLIEQYDGHSTAEEMMNRIVSTYGGFMNQGIMLTTGSEYYEEYAHSIFPNTEYSIIAFGYSGGVTSAPELVTFKTLPPANNPEDCTFEVNALPATPYYFEVELTPSDKTVYYAPNICAPEDFDAEQIEAELEQKYEDMLYEFNNNPQGLGNYNMSDIIGYSCYKGNNILTASGLTPETTYTFYVAVVEPTSGDVLKVVEYPSLSTTPALGTVNTVPVVVGYYSGDEEAGQVFGDRPATAGKAIAVVRFDTDGPATGIYSCYVMEDDYYPYMDEEISPDSYMFAQFKGDYNMQFNIIEQPYSFYVVGWREKWVSLSYATDENGVYNKMSRLLMQATAQNKGNIQELIDLVEELSSSTKSMIPYRHETIEFNGTPHIPMAANEIQPRSFSASEEAVPAQTSMTNGIFAPRMSKLIVF